MAEIKEKDRVSVVEGDKDEELSIDEQEVKVKLKADREQFEQEKAELAEQQKVLIDQQAQVNTNLEKSITISESDVDMGKFNKIDNPKAFAVEQAKQEKNCAARKVNRIAKAKAAAESTPIQVREGLLRSRLTRVRKKLHHTYKKEQIDLWAQELTVIIQTPNAWFKGCVKPKKQLSALDKLDKLW